ncbi:hypothetical protein PVK06_022903 [Gossypium arboreum]|uniref:Uncharacterized protein n=1 Tax=Gossypium arboreum TaxID=29729 RepID=A0ABR0P9S7_GOSAR|nr:hypothetical protein PVK06_022903 [Gossypium arboreum]
MELINDKDVEAMVALYCWTKSGHSEPIQLFSELADVEPVEDFTSLGEENRVQDPCTNVPRASVDRQLLATLMPRMRLKQVKQMEAGHVFAVEVKKAMDANRQKARLRTWGNELSILCDVSMWEVPLSTFKLVPNKGLYRKPKGHPHVIRIQDENGLEGETDPKHYNMCRTVSHTRTKCPHRTCHIRQSSRSSGI